MAQKVNSKAYQIMLSTMLSHSVEEVDVANAPTEDEAVYLDAREKKEFMVSHLKNAIWIGYDQPHFKNVKDLPKDTPLVVYCSIGYRSEKIAEQLKKQGFTDVKNLYGGIFEWKNQGQKVYQDQLETDSIHAYNRMWGVWLTKGTKVYP